MAKRLTFKVWLTARVLYLFLAAGMIYWLWNLMLTGVVPVRAIGYFEAMGLKVLCSYLLPTYHAVRVVEVEG